MSSSSTGRVALVTGGGRGIGRAISLGLADDGFDVAIGYRRDAAAAAEVVAAIAGKGRAASAYPADLADTAAVEQLVASAAADFGRLDVVVANGGIASRGHSVADTDPAELERVLRVHALGAHALCRAAVPHLRQHDRSDVILISSVATLTHAANGAPYTMAKAALEALGLTLAKEELRHGMRVNIVAPGLVDTQMGQRLMQAVAGIDDLRTLDPAMPFGHVCTPDDVANVVRWLVGDANTYVTGQKVNVDGLASFSR
ncbi:MAG: SDR family oxidoreductase [Acidimicrobiales bacterium]